MIGIVVAIQEELNAVLNEMQDYHKINIYNLEFYEGKIANKEIVLVKCGVGKVNAARTTQLLIDKFNIKYIINVGVAGGIDNDIKIGDIVIADKLVQHDFNIKAFNHPRGYITNLGQYFYSDNLLIEKIHKIINDSVVGTIASGDIFCTDPIMGSKIKKEFGAIAIEMEGASIAQVCILCNIPFVVIRSISDILNSNNHIDYEKFVDSSSKRIANFIIKYLKQD